jgi:hypothetical protein
MSTAQRLDWDLQPLDVLRRWPTDMALAALLSGDDSSWSRVSVIGVPSEWKILRARDGMSAQDVLAWIRSLKSVDDPHNVAAQTDEPPIGSGWFTQFSYEIGAVLEPTARAHHDQSAGATNTLRDASQEWPLAQAARCDKAFVFDHERQQWWSIGGARFAWLPARLRILRAYAQRGALWRVA